MLNSLQSTLLVLVSLMGIPAGLLLKYYTKEEMKPGKKWFEIIAVVSIASILPSLFLVHGDNLALALSASAFIFFLSVVPLIRKNRK